MLAHRQTSSKLRIAERRGIETQRPKKRRNDKRQFDVVVEASGAAAGFDLALDLLRPKGQLVLKSTFHGKTELDAARIVVDEISIVGSRCGRFTPALDLLKKRDRRRQSDQRGVSALEWRSRDAPRRRTRGVLKGAPPAVKTGEFCFPWINGKLLRRYPFAILFLGLSGFREGGEICLTRLENNTTEQERTILRKLRVWIAALAVACLVAGIGIGAMLSGRPTIAQPDMQIARAPEALSASFAEIARRVEPAVVNIETTQVQPEVSEKDEDKEDQSAIRCSICFAAASDVQRAASAAASSSVRTATS